MTQTIIPFEQVVRFTNENETATVGFVLDEEIRTIEITHILGHAPYAVDVAHYLLTQTTVLQSINTLAKQKGEAYRSFPSKVIKQEGKSSAVDFTLLVKEPVGGSFYKTYPVAHIHISMYGKLNAGFGNENNRMYLLDVADILVACNILQRQVCHFGNGAFAFQFFVNEAFLKEKTGTFKHVGTSKYTHDDKDGFDLPIADYMSDDIRQMDEDATTKCARNQIRVI